jgi:histidine triad (HIT) family protein
MTQSDTSCTFCAIFAGQAPGSVAYADGDIMAVMALYPRNQGHLLVLPKRHVPTLAELDTSLGCQLFVRALQLQQTLRQAFACEGMHVLISDGVATGQTLFHLHIHLIPRYLGDSVRMKASVSQGERQMLDYQAHAIKQTYVAMYGDHMEEQ